MANNLLTSIRNKNITKSAIESYVSTARVQVDFNKFNDEEEFFDRADRVSSASKKTNGQPKLFSSTLGIVAALATYNAFLTTCDLAVSLPEQQRIYKLITTLTQNDKWSCAQENIIKLCMLRYISKNPKLLKAELQEYTNETIPVDAFLLKQVVSEPNPPSLSLCELILVHDLQVTLARSLLKTKDEQYLYNLESWCSEGGPVDVYNALSMYNSQVTKKSPIHFFILLSNLAILLTSKGKKDIGYNIQTIACQLCPYVLKDNWRAVFEYTCRAQRAFPDKLLSHQIYSDLYAELVKDKKVVKTLDPNLFLSFLFFYMRSTLLQNEPSIFSVLLNCNKVLDTDNTVGCWVYLHLKLKIFVELKETTSRTDDLFGNIPNMVANNLRGMTKYGNMVLQSRVQFTEAAALVKTGFKFCKLNASDPTLKSSNGLLEQTVQVLQRLAEDELPPNPSQQNITGYDTFFRFLNCVDVSSLQLKSYDLFCKLHETLIAKSSEDTTWGSGLKTLLQMLSVLVNRVGVSLKKAGSDSQAKSCFNLSTKAQESALDACKEIDSKDLEFLRRRYVNESEVANLDRGDLVEVHRRAIVELANRNDDRIPHAMYIQYCDLVSENYKLLSNLDQPQSFRFILSEFSQLNRLVRPGLLEVKKEIMAWLDGPAQQMESNLLSKFRLILLMEFRYQIYFDKLLVNNKAFKESVFKSQVVYYVDSFEDNGPQMELCWEVKLRLMILQVKVQYSAEGNVIQAIELLFSFLEKLTELCSSDPIEDFESLFYALWSSKEVLELTGSPRLNDLYRHLVWLSSKYPECLDNSTQTKLFAELCHASLPSNPGVAHKCFKEAAKFAGKSKANVDNYMSKLAQLNYFICTENLPKAKQLFDDLQTKSHESSIELYVHILPTFAAYHRLVGDLHLAWSTLLEFSNKVGFHYLKSVSNESVDKRDKELLIFEGCFEKAQQSNHYALLNALLKAFYLMGDVHNTRGDLKFMEYSLKHGLSLSRSVRSKFHFEMFTLKIASMSVQCNQVSDAQTALDLVPKANSYKIPVEIELAMNKQDFEAAKKLAEICLKDAAQQPNATELERVCHVNTIDLARRTGLDMEIDFGKCIHFTEQLAAAQYILQSIQRQLNPEQERFDNRLKTLPSLFLKTSIKRPKATNLAIVGEIKQALQLFRASLPRLERYGTHGQCQTAYKGITSCLLLLHEFNSSIGMNPNDAAQTNLEIVHELQLNKAKFFTLQYLDGIKKKSGSTSNKACIPTSNGSGNPFPNKPVVPMKVVEDMYREERKLNNRDYLQSVIDLLPEDLGFVTMDYLEIMGILLITRFDKSLSKPVTFQINVGRLADPTSTLKTLLFDDDGRLRNQNETDQPTMVSVNHFYHQLMKKILEISQRELSRENKKHCSEWWDDRNSADRQMRSLQVVMENTWLGASISALMHTRYDIDTDALQLLAERLKEIVQYTFSSLREAEFTLDLDLLRVLVNLDVKGSKHAASGVAQFLRAEFASKGLSAREFNQFNAEFVAVWETFFEELKTAQDAKAPAAPRVRHLVLAIDDQISHLPFENIGTLLDSSLSRIPNLFFLKAQLLQRPVTEGSDLGRNTVERFVIDKDDGFYVLNPDCSLASTQGRLEFLSEVTKWTGIVGRNPDQQELIDLLKSKDLYLFIGHGSGDQLLHRNHLADLSQAPTCMLMGCSSAKLKVCGSFPGYGTVYSYLIGGSASVLGCLWDVTDADIDKYTIALLRNWGLIPGDSEFDLTQNLSLTNVIRKTRGHLNMKYINGSSIVSYGLPVFIKRG